MAQKLNHKADGYSKFYKTAEQIAAYDKIYRTEANTNATISSFKQDIQRLNQASNAVYATDTLNETPVRGAGSTLESIVAVPASAPLERDQGSLNRGKVVRPKKRRRGEPEASKLCTRCGELGCGGAHNRRKCGGRGQFHDKFGPAKAKTFGPSRNEFCIKLLVNSSDWVVECTQHEKLPENAVAEKKKAPKKGRTDQPTRTFLK
ncbi:hypothetical protein OIO90_000742 [Microbotryomycetes sp. JL221]|nr:hypothetical protein OIO90_000742 [Microbotryomycetes sp. JL221]